MGEERQRKGTRKQGVDSKGAVKLGDKELNHGWRRLVLFVCISIPNGQMFIPI